MTDGRSRVLALGAQGPSEPSFRIRIASMAAPLHALGVDLHTETLFSDTQAAAFDTARLPHKAALATRARRHMRRVLAAQRATPHTTLVHRRVDIRGDLALERRAARAQGSERLVYDVDDAIWFDADREGAHPLARLKASKRKVRWLAAHADAVIAGNSLLADHLARYSPNVSVVPSVVDTGTTAVRGHAEREHPVLGWIGSPTTAPFLAGLGEPLARLAAAGAALPHLLVLGGAVAPPQGCSYEQQPWSQAAERAALARIDVGLMPLPDNDWTRGKCGYKAILYMAAGIPVVADDVGVTREVLGPGGIAVRGRDEWVDALHALLSDAPMRARIGQAGREHVERHYSVARWAPILARLLRG